MKGYTETIQVSVDSVTQYGYNNCFDLHWLPEDLANWESFILKDSQDARIVSGDLDPTSAINCSYNYLPSVQRFQGNKTIKRMYICIDPSYIGTVLCLLLFVLKFIMNISFKDTKRIL